MELPSRVEATVEIKSDVYNPFLCVSLIIGPGNDEIVWI
jgi:hypothetical protein